MPLPVGVSFLGPTIPVHVFEGEAPGPTAIVEAGIHGDEIAGVHAIEEVLEEGFSIRRGRALLIPRMNPAAYRARARTRPGGLDLNRCFPGDAEAEEPEKRLARQYMDLVLDERPALLVTLHESTKRHHPDVPASFGQTVVYGIDEMPPVAARICDRMNEELQHPYERWCPHLYPVSTSSTEVIVDAIGCVGLCIETWMGFEERRRIDMQRRVVTLLLEDLAML